MKSVLEQHIKEHDEIEERWEKLISKPMVKKTIIEPKMEKSQPTKINFKSNEMTSNENEERMKIDIISIIDENINDLKHDLSNLKEWIEDTVSGIELLVQKSGLDKYLDIGNDVLGEFLISLIHNAYLNEKLTKEQAIKAVEMMDSYFDLNNIKSYPLLKHDLKISVDKIDNTAKPKKRNENINSMSETDKAKTGESVNDVDEPKKPYVRKTRLIREPKEKVMKVSRTPKPKLEFADILKKQLKSTIKEHPFNLEVYQNPTKSTITFNKKGDIATIRPTFKAKITFP